MRARDTKPSHVPSDTAADFVEIVAKRGALRASNTKMPTLPLRARVIDPRALLRDGGRRFRARRGQVLTQGELVLLESWQGRYGRVLDTRTKEPLGWTLRSNLELIRRRRG